MAVAPKPEKERTASGQKTRPMQWQDERIRFSPYQDKQILFVDFSHCSAVQVEKIARAVPDYVMKQPLGSVLILSDFTAASIDADALRTLKESAVFNKPHVRRSAFIGADNFPQEFYRQLKAFAARELPIFKTRQEALDWLILD